MMDIYDIYKMLKTKTFKQEKPFLLKVLETYPNDIYLLTEMANTLWGLYDNVGALEYVKKAEVINLSYPLLLYVKGKVLSSMGDYKGAIAEWDKIISASIADLMRYGFGRKWAKSIQNDSKWYKADALHHLYMDAEAEQVLREHLINRQKGVQSDFTLKETKNFLRMLELNDKDPEARYKDYSTGYATDEQWHRIDKVISRLRKENKFKLAKYLERKSMEFPNEYYIKILLSETYFDIKDKVKCLKYGKEAYSIAPDDMLVVYDFGAALYLNGKYEDAITTLNIILNKGLDYVAYSEHGEGKRWAKTLIKDTEEIITRSRKELSLISKDIK